MQANGKMERRTKEIFIVYQRHKAVCLQLLGGTISRVYAVDLRSSEDLVRDGKMPVKAEAVEDSDPLRAATENIYM